MELNLQSFLYALIIMFLAHNVMIAQDSEYRFINFGVQNGLSNSHSTDIIEDSNGFIWIATHDGLNRFDGYSFKIYRHNPFDSTSISSNKIIRLHLGLHNTIWITTNKGIDCIDLITERVKHYNFDYLGQDESENQIVSDFLNDEKNNRTFIATNKGLLIYDYIQKSFELSTYLFDVAASLSDNRVNVLFMDSGHRLWIGTKDGLNLFINGAFYRVFSTDEERGLYQNITAICEDKRGGIWFGGWGLYKIKSMSLKERGAKISVEKFVDEQQVQYKKQASILSLYVTIDNVLIAGTRRGISTIDLKHGNSINWYFYEDKYLNRLDANHITHILEDNQKRIWLESQTKKGLIMFDRTANQPVLITAKTSNANWLPSNYINTLLLDSSLNLWIGTEQGISKLSLKKKYFNTKLIYTSQKNYSSTTEILDLIEIPPDYWIGTRNGLYQTDKNLKIKKHYNYFEKSVKSLPSKSVSTIYPDKDGFIWLGFLDYKVSKFYPQSNTFKHYLYLPDNPDHLQPWSSRAILVDKDNDVWMGFSSGGLVYYERNTDRFRYLTPYGDETYNNNSFGIHCLFEVPEEDEIWLGTKEKGLFIYNKLNKEWEIFTHSNLDSTSLYGNEVWSIHKSKNNDNIFWIGTNIGLNRFDRNSNQFKYYNTDNGLPGNIIYGILEDHEGNLWLTTTNSLCKFNPIDENVTVFGEDDGLVLQDFNSGTYLQSDNGQMLFGGSKGVLYFHPDSVQSKVIFPNVVISELELYNQVVHIGQSVNGRVILDSSLIYKTDLSLSYEENDFSLKFSALHHTSPEKIYYSYKLSGFDSDWKNVDYRNRYAAYTNLPPGQYQLLIKASNNNRYWPESSKQLNIFIQPPFWQTTWFKISTTILIFSLVFILTRLRTIRIEKQRQLLSKKVKVMAAELEESHMAKYRFFTNISHELRTPLTLILHPAKKLFYEDYVNSEGKHYVKTIVRNANKLLRLVNQLLDFRKLESGLMRLEVTAGNIFRFCTQIYESFVDLAHTRNIDYKFIAEEKLHERIVYFDPDNLEKILFNLLSNAFKYTPDGGSIEFQIRYTDQAGTMLQLEVKDSGIGIPTDQRTKIFERFHRVENQKSRKKNGTGIGLALTKELVNLHKGHIDVKKNNSKGTIFIITIPINKESYLKSEISENENSDFEYESNTEYQIEFDENDIDRAYKSSKSQENNKHVGEKILLIDDNEDIRDLIRGELEINYSIFEASNGKEGIEIAKKEIPQLIICDIMMPEMDGFEFCKAIKDYWLTAHIPVLMLTALTSNNNKLKGFNVGADDYISKPFHAEILKTKVKNHLRQYYTLKKWLQTDLPDVKSGNTLKDKNELLIKQIGKIIEDNLSDYKFDVEALSQKAGISRMHLHRKLKAIFGISASDYLRTIRLKKAAQLLRKKTYQASEVAYKCGFNDPSYFSKSFKKHFGMTPTEYIEKTSL